MLQNAFVTLDESESESVLVDVNPVLDGTQFKTGTVTILGQALSFYPGYRLLDIADYESMPSLHRYVIYKPEDIIVLNWTNEPVYALNKNVPLSLTEHNVSDYVRFFFSYVRGKHGRFIPVESIDDIAWREEPPVAAARAIGEMIEPVHILEDHGDGTYKLVMRMIFKDSLFKCTIDIGKGGMVDIIEEEILIDGMPVLDDTFGQ